MPVRYRPSAVVRKRDQIAGVTYIDKLSIFEYQVIEALARIDSECEVLLAQLAVAEVISRDYTGVGLYVEISIPSTAPKLDLERWKMEDMLRGHAEHPALPAGAGLIVWLRNGLITCLEAYTHEGDWPRNEALFRVATS